MLVDSVRAFGGDRQAVLCRELTKRFEERRAGTLETLSSGVEADPPKGEIVVLIDRPAARAVSDDQIVAALEAALGQGTVRDAAAEVAAELGIPRRQAYQIALGLSKSMK